LRLAVYNLASHPPADIVLILLATVAVGGVSIALAALVSFRWLARFVERMVSFSIGILLATTFLHLLPEAFAQHATRHADHEQLFAVMLAGLLTLFFLEKLALFRHSHHYEGDGHHHEHGHDAREAGSGGTLILLGSGLHNFVDGVLIAGAFLAGPWVGLVATLAILAHEVPHKIGDFVVLLNAGLDQRRAFELALLSTLMIVAGGVCAYFLLEHVEAWIPHVLVLAGSSFIYIALSDLVPQMQRGLALRETLTQAVLIAAGIAVIFFLHGVAHIG